MAKARKLKDITTKEVSLVDKPANMLPFLFFKRTDGQSVELLQKANKIIKIEIESDSTVKGTTITINGDELGELKSFDFSFWDNDPKARVSCSYSKVVESEDGFKRTESYYLSKGDVTMDGKTLKALQKYLGVSEVDFEKSASEEEVQKAMELITKHYKEVFPEELEKAVGVIAKCAIGSIAESESLEKAGAKFSKDTIRKLQSIIAAAESLKSMLEGANKQSTEKSEKEENKDSDFSKGLEELTKSIEAMKKTVEDGGEEKKEDDALTKLTKAVEGMSDRLKTVEKGGATKKSLEDQDDDDDDDENVKKGAGEDGKVLWPSFGN